MGRVLSAKSDSTRQPSVSSSVPPAIDPVNAEALRRLARTYQNMNRLERCRENLPESHTASSQRLEWGTSRSAIITSTTAGNWAKAAQFYQRVLDLTPGNYNAYNDLGAAVSAHG